MTFGLMGGEASDDSPRGPARPANARRGGLNQTNCRGEPTLVPPAIAPADQPPRRGHRAAPAADSPPSALRHHLVADTVGSARGPGSLMVASPTAGGTRAVGIGGMLVGFGVIAEGHAAGYRQQDAMEIVSVVDPSAERRHAAEAALPGVRTYPALELALEWERPSFVDVCTPPVFHLPMMVECLSRDIDVLCEKPLVMNGQELAVLRSALAASAGRLYPCHNYKFAPAVQAMVGHFSDRQPLEGRFTIVRCGHALGVDPWDPHWRRRLSVGGGGILRDHGPHSVYLAEHFVGKPATGVSCMLGYPTIGPWMDTEETVDMTLFFDDVLVDVHLTWNGSERRTRYEIDLDEDTIALDGDSVEVISTGTRAVSTFPSDFDDPRHGEWFACLLADAAVRLQEPDGTRPLIDEAFRTIQTIDGAYRSAAEGSRRIALDASPDDSASVPRSQHLASSNPTP